MKELIFTEDNRVKGFDLILRRESELCDIETSHGYLLNNIFVKNNDYTRSTMKVAFDKATVPVIEPDRPIIVSTYNRDLNYFNPYKVNKPRGTSVIKKIYRNISEGDPRFCIIYKIKNKVFVMEHKRFITFGEGTSIYNETFEGDFIKKTTSFTDDGMLCLGQNALVLYTNELDIIEDSSLVSDTFAERNKALYNQTISVDLNDNVIFSREIDPAFPIFNRIKKDNIGISYSNDKNYSSLIEPHAHFSGEQSPIYLKDVGYFLGDMDIYYSMSVYDNFNHSYLKGLMDKDMKYQNEIYEVLKSLSSSDMIMDVSVTKFLDDYEYRFIKRASLRDGIQELKRLRINFHFLKESPIAPGQKLSGGYGDKTTVSKVGDGSEHKPFFIDEHGRKADLVKPDAGVPNRTNTGQCSEHTWTHYSYMMLHGLEEQNASREQVEEAVIKKLMFFDKNIADSYREKFKSDPTFWLFLLEQKQIYLDANPFKYDFSISNYPEYLDFVMSTYPEKYKTPEDLLLKIYRNGVYVGKAMMGYIYIGRAKQDANSKESLRSIDDEGADGNNKKTDKGQRVSNNPVKSSEKDKANQASVFSRREMRILEGKDKIKPMLAYNHVFCVRLRR